MYAFLSNYNTLLMHQLLFYSACVVLLSFHLQILNNIFSVHQSILKFRLCLLGVATLQCYVYNDFSQLPTSTVFMMSLSQSLRSQPATTSIHKINLLRFIKTLRLIQYITYLKLDTARTFLYQIMRYSRWIVTLLHSYS